MDWTLFWQILVAACAAVAGAAAAKIFEARVRLQAWYLHSGSITMNTDQGPTRIHNHVVVIRNVGKKPATNIRMLHANLPDFSVIPEVPYTIEDMPMGGKAIVIEKIVPGEQLNVSYLYKPPLTYDQINAGIRHDEGFAKALNMVHSPQMQRWQILSFLALLVIGATTVLFGIANVTQYVIQLLRS